MSGWGISLALMLDGTMPRSRGKDWGLKPESLLGDRVAWHELKAGLVVRLPESSTGKRPVPEKYYVATAGGPEAVGRALYSEALRRGLQQARRVYVIADGALWISQGKTIRLPAWFRGDGIRLFPVERSIQAARTILEQCRRKKSARVGTRMEKR